MSTPQTTQNQFVDVSLQDPQQTLTQDFYHQDQTLPQTFTASTACVREKKNVVSNVTTLSLYEQDWMRQIDDMLNCDEANCAFATLQKKMEQDEKQKTTVKENKNSKITVWLFNNTYLACGITFKKRFYYKHIHNVQTIVLVAVAVILLLGVLLLCYFILNGKIFIKY